MRIAITCASWTASTNAMAYAVDTSASTCHTECQCLSSGSFCDDTSSRMKLVRAGTASATALLHRRDCAGKRAGTAAVHHAAADAACKDVEMQAEVCYDRKLEQF